VIDDAGEGAAPSAAAQIAELTFALLLLDETSTVREVNQAAEDLFGAGARRMMGQTLRDLLSFGDEISFDAHLAVARLTRCLEGVPGILNLHPAYTSLLVDFDRSVLAGRMAAILDRAAAGTVS